MLGGVKKEAVFLLGLGTADPIVGLPVASNRFEFWGGSSHAFSTKSYVKNLVREAH